MVSAVIVSMRNSRRLRDALSGLLQHTKTPLEVFVVAYLYPPEELESLRKDFPDIHIVESNETRGFSENNNLALRQVSGEYCFIVNDDTLIDSPLVDELVDDMLKFGPRCAAVTPRIVFPSGKVQTCGRAPWNAWRWMKHYLHLVDETIPTKWSMKVGQFRTWTLNGACFLARTSVFRKAGWFDERFFFTPEDIAIGQKFNEMGYQVWCDSDAVIVHIAGDTASTLGPAIKAARVKGALLYYAPHRFGRFFLKLYVAVVEFCRLVKHGFRESVASAVLGSVFTSETPKETFIRINIETEPPPLLIN
ncbi:MAG: glycosyltransferase [Bacteroidales bacterium]|nr:glycosyltransferase [Bacteroidales bacterium]